MHKRKLLVVALFALTIAAAMSIVATAQDITFTTKSPEALKFFTDGLEQSDALLFDKAAPLFEKAVNADPDFAMAYYYWTLTSVNNEQFQMRLDKAVELAPKVSEPERLIILALKATFDDRNDLAREYYGNLIKEVQGSKRAHLLYGTFLYGQQDWPGAESQFQAAITLDPGFASAYNMLAYTYSSQKKHAVALKALQKYSELRPTEANPHDSMGEIYLWMSDYDNSIKEYGRSLQLDSTFLASADGIGHNYVFKGEYDKARAQYERRLTQAKSVADTTTAYLWKAVSYMHEGKTQKAIEALNEEINLARTHNDILLEALIHGQMGAIYRETGNLDNAMKEAGLERNLASNSEVRSGPREQLLRDCATTEAVVLTRQGKADLAQAKVMEYQKSMVASKDPLAASGYHSLLGEMAFYKNDYQTAIKELQQASMEDPLVKYYLATCYEKTNDPATATKLFSELAGYNKNGLSYSMVRAAAKAKA